MHLRPVATALRSRALRPGRLGWLLLLAAAWALLRLAIDIPYGRFGYGEAFTPLGLLIIGLMLSPAAWQWSGSEAPLTSMRRGILQSLLWNSLWLILLILGLRHWADTTREPQPRPSPGREAPPQVPPEWREQASRWDPGPSDGPNRPPRSTPPPSPELQLFSLGLLLTSVLGRVLAERERGEAREALLRSQEERARGLALQAQMQPHALFNALSGLVELAQEDPEATELALIALCRYLRQLMDHARVASAPLRQERELLEAYLRIEQIRLGDALNVTWSWPDWADDLQLPPLLIQPLVENAIVHGIAPSAGGGDLLIALSREEGELLLRVDNTGLPPEGNPEARRQGLGLGHLHERLALWGGPEARLTLAREEPWTRACLRFPEPLAHPAPTAP